MASMTNVEFGGFLISFSSTNHNGSQYIDLLMIGHDGKFAH
jgi:hypothetical protein